MATSDEIGDLLKQMPVVRCPNGHAGPFQIVETGQYLYRVAEALPTSLVVAWEDQSEFQRVSVDILCNTCGTVFPKGNIDLEDNT